MANGHDDSTDHGDKQKCLLNAFRSGKHAELAAEYPTDEAVPIKVRFRVVGKKRVEVRRDETRDSGGVSTEVCSELFVNPDQRSVLSARGCK